MWRRIYCSFAKNLWKRRRSPVACPPRPAPCGHEQIDTARPGRRRAWLIGSARPPGRQAGWCTNSSLLCSYCSTTTPRPFTLTRVSFFGRLQIQTGHICVCLAEHIQWRSKCTVVGRWPQFDLNLTKHTIRPCKYMAMFSFKKKKFKNPRHIECLIHA
jgi:hypothetical protein